MIASAPGKVRVRAQDGMTGIRTIGVIGAGQMGNGIAHVCALAGFDVILNDVSADRLEAGLKTIKRNMDRQVHRQMITTDARDAAVKRIRTANSLAEFGDVDFAIEAATEKEDVKRKIFDELCPRLRKDAMVASNTSSISITRLGTATDRPERFIGLHFMNPVPLMRLVEVIRGLATDQETYDAAVGIVERVGKHVTNAEDFPAFIVNRVLMPMINEAVYTLYEGVGSVEAIDTAMKLGANHPMGPLELADFIGLDTCLSIMQVLHEGLADTKYRPCPLLVKYVEAGWVGKKVGRGFYDYRGETPVPTR
ncbi:MAG TPA: 3-hydroxybutyryl-CoA dehydrogenase [Hyphomonadaceae bacterium]|nr:3-hydroxybutyryl-CoA dehydrogenase [Hyphomonadaceae bacterium]